MTANHCPRCGHDREPNDSGWPILVDGEIRDGGCQNCWEADCDEAWWRMAKCLPVNGEEAHAR